jgi:hypothetical protein
MAQEKARTRLSSLNGSSLVPAEVAEAASPPKPSAEPAEPEGAKKSTDCRRFIPSAGTTVAVKCDE